MFPLPLQAARFASCPWLGSICYRRRTRALKSAAGAQIRGSGSSGLAARPRSRRCSECCDSIHPPAGHIYQCVPSLERAEYEIAMRWQLGEQRTGGAAIQRTGVIYASRRGQVPPLSYPPCAGPSPHYSRGGVPPLSYPPCGLSPCHPAANLEPEFHPKLVHQVVH